MKANIKDMSSEAFGEWLVRHEQPPYRAAQIQRWLYQKGAETFAEMTDLSSELRRALEEDFSISALRTVHRSPSVDGTIKFLFGLDDGLRIESVLIPEKKRVTLCISTQVGCGLGCAFCATALMGLKRNLRASEILDQILEARRSVGREQKITHVVLMGMGEPLANYRPVVQAVETMANASAGVGISPRRITLSTVGLVPQIKKLMQDTRVNLAISLHATTNDLRSQMMPINSKYPLEELIDCCRSLPIPKRRRITFEYVLLRGVNDSPADALRLAKLLQGIRCKLNLIPFNSHPGSPYQRPGPAEVELFQSTLHRKGYQVNVRETRGGDIQAACGQLQAELSLGEAS